jgi:hypothetical protein
MTTLHLGVTVVPYQIGRNRQDTGGVADILEARYGIMQAFWNKHGQEYIDGLVMGSVEAMEAQLTGRSVRVDRRTVLSKMQGDFRRFISQREVENAVRDVGPLRFPVPTQAAIKGISHRRAHPYAKRNPRRPSFRDTGLYEASFRAWVD